MIEELLHLLDRQTEAVTTLERRLRALELVAADDQHRFVALAMDEVETASDQLAGLELTRSLALTSAGLSPDLSGTELVHRFSDADDAARLASAIDQLRRATDRLADARDRARTVVGRSAQDVRTRVEATMAFADA
jgi:hypothetical protein